MFGLSPMEMLIVGVVAILLFGSRLPTVARSMGKSVTEFRRGMQDLQQEFRGAMHEAEVAARAPATGTKGRLPAPAAVAHNDSASDTSYDTRQPPEETEVIEAANADVPVDRPEGAATPI